ncbi:MAG: helix-turn-helix transcriptional regulator [Chloroflexi bacterium]|nr:helix-turn-helix transcriptional regulator [Chloroflexota bacterium]MBI4198631.1 helix-turn-helix transcriptional regulator [Chloroflexota bacterium]
MREQTGPGAAPSIVPSLPRPASLQAARQRPSLLSFREAPEGPSSPPNRAAPHVEGVYIISVAARIVEMHPQTLRKYERVGLVHPTRTMGMLRLYSEQDIARLRLIKHLVDDVGMNLAGVEFVLHMFNRMLEARTLLEAIQDEASFAQDLRQGLLHLLGLLDIEGSPPGASLKAR